VAYCHIQPPGGSIVTFTGQGAGSAASLRVPKREDVCAAANKRRFRNNREPATRLSLSVLPHLLSKCLEMTSPIAIVQESSDGHRGRQSSFQPPNMAHLPCRASLHAPTQKYPPEKSQVLFSQKSKRIAPYRMSGRRPRAIKRTKTNKEPVELPYKTRPYSRPTV
jgi:hypothetical protein